MTTAFSDRDHDEQNDARYHDELRLLETELALTEVAIRAGLILNATMARVWGSAFDRLWCEECRCVTNHRTAQHQAAEAAMERNEP